MVDELGFHQATSVAELLADRGCAVEIATPGIVVGQDLGLTLEMETFLVRAHAKKIRLTTDRVVLAAAQSAGGGVALRILHHPLGADEELSYDRVVCAVPQAPEDGLWRELRDGDIPVHRVGAVLAPRRVHSAVIDGHRIAVSL